MGCTEACDKLLYMRPDLEVTSFEVCATCYSYDPISIHMSTIYAIFTGSRAYSPYDCTR